MAQLLKFDEPASLFASLTPTVLNELLEEIEKDKAGAFERTFVMIVTPSGEFTAVPLSSMPIKALKLLVSLGQALCTSDLALQVLVRLVEALDATEATFTAEDFSPIITGLTDGSTDFSGTTLAVQAEVTALKDDQCPRPLCWVVAVFPVPDYYGN